MPVLAGIHLRDAVGAEQQFRTRQLAPVKGHFRRGANRHKAGIKDRVIEHHHFGDVFDCQRNAIHTYIHHLCSTKFDGFDFVIPNNDST
jgi:hypothetical protein